MRQMSRVSLRGRHDTGAHRKQVRVAREEMPAPSSWEQPERFSVDSAVSSDSGARSALRRMPAQCCSFSAVRPVSELSGSSLRMHLHAFNASGNPECLSW